MRLIFAGTILLTVVACSAPEDSGPPIETTPAATRDTAESQQALATYLKESFGMPGHETSWYGSILKVEIAGDTAIVHTNLAAAGEPASEICGAVSGYVFSNQNRGLGIVNVHVMGTGGPLIQRNGISAPCR